MYPKPEYYLDTSEWEKCLACPYFGSEENKGYCSVCVKNQNPSNESLKRWMEKREASRVDRAHQRISNWEKEEAKQRKLYKRVSLLAELLKKVNIHSIQVDIPPVRDVDKINYIVPISFFGDLFGRSLKCLCLPGVVTDDMLDSIPSYFPNLEHLALQGPLRVALHRCFSRLPLLSHLNLSNLMWGIYDTLGELPVMNKIRSLSLAGSTFYNKDGISLLVSKFPSLVNLDLRCSLRRVLLRDDRVEIELAAKLEHLVNLDIRNNGEKNDSPTIDNITRTREERDLPKVNVITGDSTQYAWYENNFCICQYCGPPKQYPPKTV